ncbi:MAG: 50S ribosomal protein L11 methyltransferase, partial [Gemmatimonadetes bacterium]|nr:50S ribosomal protein L11 methyltransferase [Gemmatimonadota bacterium]
MVEDEGRARRVTWTTFRIIPGAGRDAVVAALFGAGAQAVQEDGAAIITSFPPGTDLAAVQAAVKGADGTAMVAATELPDIDWSEAWKARLTAHEVGGLVITPPWLAAGHDPATSIVIDPGMAFGTGDHPTTRGVLRLLRRFVHPGMTVADLGAGSAALAIAAAKLGAARVAAIELDGDAIENAIENCVVNGVADRVQVIEGD